MGAMRYSPINETKPGPKLFPSAGKQLCGRSDIGIPKDARSRVQKLVDVPIPVLKNVAQELRAAGKDATVSAVGAMRYSPINKMHARTDPENRCGRASVHQQTDWTRHEYSLPRQAN
jgi:hypothetical protein